MHPCPASHSALRPRNMDLRRPGDGGPNERAQAERLLKAAVFLVMPACCDHMLMCSRDSVTTLLRADRAVGDANARGEAQRPVKVVGLLAVAARACP